MIPHQLYPRSWLALWATCLALAGCATILPRTYTISKQELVKEVEAAFPYQRTYAGDIFGIDLATPSLQLVPETRRIQLMGKFIGKAIGGTIHGGYVFSSELRFNQEQQAIYLGSPQIDTLSLDSNRSVSELIRLVLNRVINEYAEKNPLYRLTTSERVLLSGGFGFNAIDVAQDGLVLKFIPRKT